MLFSEEGCVPRLRRRLKLRLRLDVIFTSYITVGDGLLNLNTT